MRNRASQFLAVVLLLASVAAFAASVRLRQRDLRRATAPPACCIAP